MRHPPQLPMTVIVLGAAVWEGGAPSPTLQRRAGHAAALWHRGGVGRIVTTGGIGRHPPAEAIVAARVCMSLGVPEAALRCEDRSTNTFENLAFARPLLPHPPGPVLLVSDRYHLPRAVLIARLMGLRARTSAAPKGTQASVPVRGCRLLREAMALSAAVPVTLWRMAWLRLQRGQGAERDSGRDA